VRNVWETELGKARLQEIAATDAVVTQSRTSRRKQALAQRMYATARNTRSTGGWTSGDTSADAELLTSLSTIRARCRALVRDSSYAKRAKTIVVNNVVGSGIGMQAQVKTSRDTLNDRVNDDIEAAWLEWSEAENCHTGGRLGFESFERALMAQVFEAGEVFVRLHQRSFGPMLLPLSLELIEAERLADDLSIGTVTVEKGNHFRLGVECDEFYRPVAYFFRTRHRGEVRFSDYGPGAVERVPAAEIIHLAVIDRWPQTRGEPWMHTAAVRLNDMDGYSEAEILRARSQAVRMGIIESGEDPTSMAEEQDDGSFEVNLEPNTIQRLNPGEKWIDSSPNAPNPNMDPFMRYMLREICAGIGPSYESVSRDYSQSNYSSSRLALLDDRDLWKFIQTWFVRDFRRKVHRAWLQQAVLSRKTQAIAVGEYVLNPRKFEAVLFKPRGWSWIDPTKEVEAYKEAIKAGFTTRTDVIAQTANGLDIEDVDATRERELRMAKEHGLEFDTDPDCYMADAAQANAAAKAAAKPPPKPSDQEEEETPSAPPKAGRAVLGVVKK
jgi:lambda family phage portal protein